MLRRFRCCSMSSCMCLLLLCRCQRRCSSWRGLCLMLLCLLLSLMLRRSIASLLGCRSLCRLRRKGLSSFREIGLLFRRRLVGLVRLLGCGLCRSSFLLRLMSSLLCRILLPRSLLFGCRWLMLCMNMLLGLLKLVMCYRRLSLRIRLRMLCCLNCICRFWRCLLQGLSSLV